LMHLLATKKKKKKNQTDSRASCKIMRPRERPEREIGLIAPSEDLWLEIHLPKPQAGRARKMFYIRNLSPVTEISKTNDPQPSL